MKEVMDPLCNSWYALLNGNLSYDTREVKVYPEDADNDDSFHHVLIRAESETDNSNKSVFVRRPVIIIEIVTKFDGLINTSVARNIGDQIRGLVFPTRKCALPPLTGLQITNVELQSSNPLKDDDGVKRIYRIVNRFIHRITQTNN